MGEASPTTQIVLGMACEGSQVIFNRLIATCEPSQAIFDRLIAIGEGSQAIFNRLIAIGEPSQDIFNRFFATGEPSPECGGEMLIYIIRRREDGEKENRIIFWCWS